MKRDTELSNHEIKLEITISTETINEWLILFKYIPEDLKNLYDSISVYTEVAAKFETTE